MSRHTPTQNHQVRDVFKRLVVQMWYGSCAVASSVGLKNAPGHFLMFYLSRVTIGSEPTGNVPSVPGSSRLVWKIAGVVRVKMSPSRHHLVGRARRIGGIFGRRR